MKILIAILTVIHFSAMAGITTKIAQINPPNAYNENYEVLAFYDGRVFEVSPESTELVELLASAAENNLAVEIDLEEPSYFMSNEVPEMILDAAIADAQDTRESVFSANDEFLELQEYEPTNVGSLEKAAEIFQSLYQRTRRWTECYNRAHIWNRQMHKDHGVKSEKIFIFYTSKYRRTYRWKWWFHTAPMVQVNGEDIVLDREFTSEPKTAADWERQFSAPNREDQDHRCKEIDGMSEYYDRQNMNNTFCNILVSPMYYWEPSELSDLENEGAVKNEWINWEIRHAAKDVLGRWVDFYNKYRAD